MGSLGDLVLLDTSVFLNVLDVPSFNQDRQAILDEFRRRIGKGDYFFLPMATIWETGNHIAHLANGNLRRHHAGSLVNQVRAAFEGEAPFKVTHVPTGKEFLEWLDDFPDYAASSKSDKHTREGTSLSDLAIIKEWEIYKRKFAKSRILIWSLDRDLCGYDTGPR